MKAHGATSKTEETTWIVYDGDCPLCANFARMTRLQHTVGQVKLINAREDVGAIKAINVSYYDLNKGMLLRYRGECYHGAQCIQMLALLSDRSMLCNRIFAALFRSHRFCRYSYPILRAGRNLLLTIRGRSPIRQQDM